MPANIWPHSRKTFEYDVRTPSPKSSNHNAVYTGYEVMIGCYSSRSTKLVLQSFMTKRTGKMITISCPYNSK